MVDGRCLSGAARPSQSASSNLLGRGRGREGDLGGKAEAEIEVERLPKAQLGTEVVSGRLKCGREEKELI